MIYIRAKGKKLYELWSYTDKNPLTDYTIGIASIEKWCKNEGTSVADL
jgi:hypothetical protein